MYTFVYHINVIAMSNMEMDSTALVALQDQMTRWSTLKGVGCVQAFKNDEVII
jgi:hypothetical protein